MIKITFPDGNVKEYEKGITALAIAQQLSRQLAESVLAASVNGVTFDLNRPITEDAAFKLYKWDDEEG
ncbi:MAG: TGS domain-containing protein, partial [Bacteroidales bacterium]|nr:TGS domain-containing protein [Bacteroidales bacterium]